MTRPGQWSDRARRRRARRLARAFERRCGFSRKGQRFGFYVPPPRALAAIHAECRAAMVEADARALEQTIGATLPAGVTMKIEMPFDRDAALHEAFDQEIQRQIAAAMLPASMLGGESSYALAKIGKGGGP